MCIRDRYKGSLLTRLLSLTNGLSGMIFTNDDISDADLFDRNVIVDLSRVGSTETKSLIMGMLVLKMQEYRMTNTDGPNAKLRHVTVIEEAHNLLKRTSTEQSSCLLYTSLALCLCKGLFFFQTIFHQAKGAKPWQKS